MFDRKKFLNSITKSEDRLWFAKAAQQAYSCAKSTKVTFTDFSDPFKAGELLSLLGENSEFKTVLYGGYSGSERVMAGFFPDCAERDLSLFPIKAVKISYNKKFCSGLSHRDFLGSVLGLGITRDKVGDIVLEDGFSVVFLNSDIVDYIALNLERVSRTKVKCEEIAVEGLNLGGEKGSQKSVTVSSLRIDAVLSSAFNLSRARAKELISSGNALLNQRSVSNGDKSVSPGDIITLRGTGRIKINEIKGKTKKDRTVLSIFIYG